MRRLLFAFIVAGVAMGWSSAAPATTQTTYVNGVACCVQTGCVYSQSQKRIVCDKSSGTCCSIAIKENTTKKR
jgi:hypothetical protein